jgi:hypothetical protein
MECLPTAMTRQVKVQKWKQNLKEQRFREKKYTPSAPLAVQRGLVAEKKVEKTPTPAKAPKSVMENTSAPSYSSPSTTPLDTKHTDISSRGTPSSASLTLPTPSLNTKNTEIILRRTPSSPLSQHESQNQPQQQPQPATTKPSRKRKAAPCTNQIWDSESDSDSNDSNLDEQLREMDAKRQRRLLEHADQQKNKRRGHNGRSGKEDYISDAEKARMERGATRAAEKAKEEVKEAMKELKETKQMEEISKGWVAVLAGDGAENGEKHGDKHAEAEKAGQADTPADPGYFSGSS